MKRLIGFLGTVGLLVTMAFAAPIATLAKAPPPKPDGFVLVVAPNATSLVGASGGRLIGPKSTFFAAFAQGDAAFFARAHEQGAWLIKDGKWLAQICGIYLG